jgi:hypothetical protein
LVGSRKINENNREVGVYIDPRWLYHSYIETNNVKKEQNHESHRQSS